MPCYTWKARYMFCFKWTFEMYVVWNDSKTILWSMCLASLPPQTSATFIGWFYCHFNNLHFRIQLETKLVLFCRKCKQGIWRYIPSWFLVSFWHVGCWNDSKASTWSLVQRSTMYWCVPVRCVSWCSVVSVCKEFPKPTPNAKPTPGILSPRMCKIAVLVAWSLHYAWLLAQNSGVCFTYGVDSG